MHRAHVVEVDHIVNNQTVPSAASQSRKTYYENNRKVILFQRNQKRKNMTNEKKKQQSITRLLERLKRHDEIRAKFVPPPMNELVLLRSR